MSLSTMNTQALHLDAAYAAAQPFGQRLMNSMWTLATMVGMSVAQVTQGTLVAQLALTEVSFPHPLFAGDTLYAETEVLEKRDSKSRPTAGLVTRNGKHLEVEPLFQPGTALLVARDGIKHSPGDLVLYMSAHGRRVKIVKVIGRKGQVRDVLEALLLDSVPHRGFTPRVLAEAAAVAQRDSAQDEGRVDLRRLFTFTIDPETARDFDDALSFVPAAGSGAISRTK